MNNAHLHLAVNHLPLITPAIGIVVLFAGFITRSEVVKRTAYFIFIIGALTTLPAFATGEGAEEMTEHLPGADRHRIHEHEESAEVFGKLNYALGAISLLGIWISMKRKKMANIIAFVILLVAGTVLFFARRAATSGGEIMHTEIREDSKTG